jgi:hypothetical protein
MSNLSALTAVSAASAAGRQVLPKNPGAGYLACPPLGGAVNHPCEDQKRKLLLPIVMV